MINNHNFTFLQALHAFFSRPWRYELLFFTLGFLSPALMCLIMGMPAPTVHDEFGNLLIADTYAHGRLSNPPHPLSQHFETFYVTQDPSYMSKYPPAPGAMIAIGQVLGGHPAVGLWLGSGLLCASFFWFLRAWVSTGYALLGGLLVYLNMGIVGYFAHSYWGGAVAAMGACILWGSAMRLHRRPTLFSALGIALGLSILALSRPWEGLLSSLPLGPFLLYSLIRSSNKVEWLMTVVPTAIISMALLFCAIAINNKAVTGSYTVMPYTHYHEQYGAVPLFHLDSTPDAEIQAKINQLPTPQHRQMSQDNFDYQWPMKYSPEGKGRRLYKLFEENIVYFLSWGLAFPFLLCFFMILRRRLLFLSVCIAYFFIVFNLGTYVHFFHYTAPLYPLMMLMAMEGLRLIRWTRYSPFYWISPLAYVCILITLVYAGIRIIGYADHDYHNIDFGEHKQYFIDHLNEMKGKDLVIVENTMDYNYHKEWVYNGADLDHAQIVWARSLENNSVLLNYYRDRRIWFLRLKPGEVRLYEYQDWLKNADQATTQLIYE